MRPLIVYHGGCPDGAGAALAAWLKFGQDADYVAGFFDKGLPKVAPGQDIYLLDFHWRRDTILSFLLAGHRVVVIDHHKTALERLEGLDDCHFDMNHSGAVLAWSYFHPEKKVPELFWYLEDRDLWKHEMPDTREINAAVKALGICDDFKRLIGPLNSWDPVPDTIPKYEGAKSRLIEMGRSIRLVENSMIENMTHNVHSVYWEGYHTAVVNASVLFSETAERAYQRCRDKEKYPRELFIGAYWFWDPMRKLYQVGLRSEVGLGPDVSVIANNYGGGGHTHSAGFTLAKLPEVWLT